MRIEDITHNHFLKLFRNGKMADSQLLRVELAYSTFIAPTFMHAGMDFLYLMGQKDDKFIPLFTDMDEYYKVFEKTDFNPKFYDFDYYLSSDMDMVINPASEGIKINTGRFRNMDETPVMPVNISKFTLSPKELKVLAEYIQNHELVSILQKQSDVKTIFKALAKSTLIMQMYDESPNVKDGMFEIPNKFQDVVISPDGYMELFTSRSELKGGNDLYVQVVNLNHFFEYLIRFDLDGFVINPCSNHVIVDRNSILYCFDEFKRIYDDSKHALASNYGFEL